MKTHDKDYIEFKNGFMECHSKVGRQGRKQEIVLAPQCAEEHTIVHEVCFLYDFQFELTKMWCINRYYIDYYYEAMM